MKIDENPNISYNYRNEHEAKTKQVMYCTLCLILILYCFYLIKETVWFLYY